MLDICHVVHTSGTFCGVCVCVMPPSANFVSHVFIFSRYFQNTTSDRRIAHFNRHMCVGLLVSTDRWTRTERKETDTHTTTDHHISKHVQQHQSICQLWYEYSRRGFIAIQHVCMYVMYVHVCHACCE